MPRNRAHSAKPTHEGDDTWIDEEWLEPPSRSPATDVDISLGHTPHPTSDPDADRDASEFEPTTTLPRSDEPSGRSRREADRRGQRRTPWRPRAVGEAARHRGRQVALLLIAGVLLAALAPFVIGLFTGSSTPPGATRATPANPGATAIGPPQPQPLANANDVALSVPITQRAITAILYHQLQDSNDIEFGPVGKLRNGNLLDRLEGRILGDESSGPSYYATDGSKQVIDVGATAGTEVYSPVDGTIVSIVPNVISGRSWGQVVIISPTSNPAVVVRLAGIQSTAGLSVGQTVKPPGTSTPTLIGTVVDLSRAQRLTLAQYTNDPGNSVEISMAYAAVTQ